MINWIISSSALILVLIALRYITRGRISPRLQYALWALVLVRLLVPVSFGSTGWSVNNLSEAVRERLAVQNVLELGRVHIPARSFESAYAQVVEEYQARGVDVSQLEGGELEALDREAYERMTGPGGSELLGRIAWYIWLSGIAVTGLCLLISNLRFAAALRKTRQECADIPYTPLPVYRSDAVETPCLFGLFRPAIYLTSEAMENETVLRHALEHETTHFCHGDHIWAFARCLCLMLHWYNPLVWLAAMLSQRDAELACDEGTIKRIGEGERVSYGNTLIDLTCEKNGAAALFRTATTMTGSGKEIRERVSRIAKRSKTLWSAAAVVVLIAVLAVGCTFTGSKKPAQTPGGTSAAGTQDQPLPAVIELTPATDELLSQYSDYDEIDASRDEYGVKLLLTTDRTIRDFRLFSLIWDETAEELVTPAEGSELYRAAELAELTPDKPLVVWVSFPGVLPTVGFSFTDADGTFKRYHIVSSGKDDSVLLMEAYPRGGGVGQAN